MIFYKWYNSPIGRLTIVATKERITHLFLSVEQFETYSNDRDLKDGKDIPILVEAECQLHEYFHEGRKEFQLPIEIKGTEFQESIWSQLQKIPYGHACSYQDVAMKIGNKNAVRAIGQANKANKLPIFIPCHRVIGKNQKLTGYAGTQNDVKAKLLTIENIAYKE
jgi:methylated-DNA-[protein]-cysteine S-methyltransferase